MGLFDSVPDWNGNGKPDMGDAFLDYMMFQAVTGDSEDKDNSDENDDS